MNPIGVALDLLLLGLLGWALVLGLKLNGRLKALREGQAGFAQAVAELDVASRRAAAGLAEMRRAAEETHDALEGRIEAARALIAQMDAASQAGTVRAPSVSTLPRRAASPRGGRLSSDDASPVEELSAKRTEGTRSRTANPEPTPVGFAEMIRRTLREPR